MSCNCGELAAKLNAINSKIDGLNAQINNKADKSIFSILSSNVNDLKSAIGGIDAKNGTLADELNAFKGLMSFVPNTVRDLLNRPTAQVSPSDIASLNRRVSALESALKNVVTVSDLLESQRKQTSEWIKLADGRYATKEALEELRRKAATKQYVDDRDDAIKRSVEKRFAQLDNEINGLQKELAQEIENRKKSIADEVRERVKAVDKVRKDLGDKITNALEKVDQKIDKALEPVNRKISALNTKVDAVIASNKVLSATVTALSATVTALSATIASLLGGGLFLMVAQLVGEILQTWGFQMQINQLRDKVERQDLRINALQSLTTLLGRKFDNLPKPNTVDYSQQLSELSQRILAANAVANEAKQQALIAVNRSLQNQIYLNALQGVVAGVTTVATTAAINAILSRFPKIRSIPDMGTNTIIERQPIVYNNTIVQPVRETVKTVPVTNTITNQPIIQPTIREVNRIETVKTVPVTNTIRERTTYTNTTINRGSDIDYGRVQQIVASETTKDGNKTRGIMNTYFPTLKSGIDRVQGVVNDVQKKARSLYENQFVQSALNTLNTAILVHNAARLSFDAGQYVGEVLGSVLNSVGVTFKDENGGEISLNQAIGDKVTGVIDRVIPQSWQDRLNTFWISSNSIFSSASQIYWALENIFDESRNVAEITNDRLGIWMNTAREEGLVSEDAYPHMGRTITKSRYGRYNDFLSAVNGRAESFSNSVETIEETASTVHYVASVPTTIGEEISTIKEQRAAIAETAIGGKQTADTLEYEQLLDNEAPVSLESVYDFMPEG